ncbi:MAG: phytanoyl-CoA dioxygenase family protein [Pseudomonadales bacterium]
MHTNRIDRNFELDPRNRDFGWQTCDGPYRRLSAAQARQYDEEGFVLVENAFTPEEMEAVIHAIDPIEAEYTQMLRDRFGGKLYIARADAITFTIHLVLRSAVLKAFSRHPVFQELCHDTMGTPCRLYWDQAVYKKPGNPDEFPWHQDNGYTFTRPQQYLTCWVALTDATLDNGCPWVVPGLHRYGTLLHRNAPLGRECLTSPQSAVAVPARAGDVVVFSSLTPHRTGPNLTDAVRKSYILQYALDGAMTLQGDGDSPAPQNDPDRQYLIHEHP